MEDKVSKGEMFLLIITAIAIFIFALVLIKVGETKEKTYTREGFEIKTYYEEDYTYYIYENKVGDVVKVDIK